MKNPPLVSVLMSVYNGEKYLNEAIDSVLQQTYHNFEFLIINDASTDNTLQIIKSYPDTRIKLINNEKNLGLVRSLNKGLDHATGKYIARMDADDVSMPERLATQVTFMEAQPLVGLAGSYVRSLGLDIERVIEFATEHKVIKFKLFFDTHFPHPAAMIRKSVLDQHRLRYDPHYSCTEDYRLWNEMADICHLAIIPEVLVHKRVHNDQISIKKVEQQRDEMKDMHKQLMMKMGLEPTDAQLSLYEQWLNDKMPRTKNEILVLLEFIEQLIKFNERAQQYAVDLFNVYFSRKYWDICSTSTHIGLEVFNHYNQSESRKYFLISWWAKFKFWLKALVQYDIRKKAENIRYSPGI